MNKNSLSINECVFNGEMLLLYYCATFEFCHSWKYVEVTVYTNVFIFNSSEMVILVILKATKSGTPALIINQAFIFSIM